MMWGRAAQCAVAGWVCVSLVALTGCIKRAPTSYELDKRSGLGTPPPDAAYEHPRRYQRRAARKAGRHGGGAEPSMRSTSLVAPTPRMPARTTPVVRRVWVADQNLGDGSWLQGTWWVVEIEPSKWLHEVDPGGAWFAEPVHESTNGVDESPTISIERTKKGSDNDDKNGSINDAIDGVSP